MWISIGFLVRPWLFADRLLKDRYVQRMRELVVGGRQLIFQLHENGTKHE